MLAPQGHEDDYAATAAISGGSGVSTALSVADETAPTSEMVVTQAFADTIRWFRERLLGLSIGAIDTELRRTFRESTFTCAKFEQRDEVLTGVDIGCYEKALYGLVPEAGDYLIGAITDAHFTAAALASNLEGPVEQLHRDRWNIGHSLGLGLELARPDEPVIVNACRLWPGARDVVRPDDLRDFMRVITQIAAWRQSPVLARLNDIDTTDLGRFFPVKARAWRERARGADQFSERQPHTRWAGVGRLTPAGQPVAIDPLVSIEKLHQAWRVARLWGAEPSEQTALAWAILLVRLEAVNAADDQRGPHMPILQWARLDAEGPAGFARVLEESGRKSDSTVAPAADLIWAAARKYLSGWHSHFVAAAYDVSLEFNPRPATPGEATAPKIDQWYLGTAIAHNADLAGDLIVYDDSQLPGLPKVLSLDAPVLTLGATSIAVESIDAVGIEAWWLPTGLSARWLVRDVDTTRWKAVQLPRGII